RDGSLVFGSMIPPERRPSGAAVVSVGVTGVAPLEEVALARVRVGERAGGELDGVGGAAVPAGARVGPQPGVERDDGAPAVHERDVQGVADAVHVDRAALRQHQPLARPRLRPRDQSAQPQPPAVGERDARAERRAARPVHDGDGLHCMELSMRTIWITVVPRTTTNSAGKMQSTSGKTSLTVVLAAASSARCRRFCRSVSAWTRSACATEVPKRSVWMSIVARERMSGTP